MNGFASITGHEVEKCAACGSNDLAIFAELRSPYLDRSERYVIRTCKRCGHGEAEGRRDAAFLSSIYNDRFFASSQQDAGLAASAVNLNATARAKWLAGLASGSLLDVGCGTGAFVLAASQYFNAAGVEFSEVAVEAARSRGLTVHHGDFLSVAFEPDSYDVVTLWDVLASLDHPGVVLSRVHGLIHGTGLLVVTIPMIDTFAARTAGRFWPMLIPPVNLHFFSRDSIIRLAESYGFEIVEMRHEGKRVSLSFIAQKAVRSLGLGRQLEKMAGWLPDWPVPINTGDVATFVLRRRQGKVT